MKGMMRIFLVIAAMWTASAVATAQTTLFDYPIAPDTCQTLESRCNYSVQHFWDNCDLTKPFAAGTDSLLVEAMDTYFNIMAAGANANLSIGSARDLMFKSQAVQANFIKLAQVAEFLLYRNPTSFRDDLYLTFAQAVADNNAVKKDMREHYRDQVKRINTTKLDERITDFSFTDINGAKHKLSELESDSVAQVLILITDGSSNSNIERMRLDTDVIVNALVEAGVLKVLNIVTGDAAKQWDKDSRELAAKWIVGANKDITSQLDIRYMPCIITLDNKLTVLQKNITVDDIKNAF